MTALYKAYTGFPIYQGTDLGLKYTVEKSIFKIWAPSATQVVLKLYERGVGGGIMESINLEKEINGVWSITISKDLLGLFYTFQALVNGEWSKDVPDPYVKAVGVNGLRGQIIDLKKTNPIAWEKDSGPQLDKPTDIILYELHIRDLSTHSNSGIHHKGKFLGLTESGTISSDGLATGLDHIKELGITHIHLLPVFDFMSIDESKLEEAQYNWGYDPQNYNVPEGSYATNPYDGATRIKEFKKMVKTLHDHDLGVVLDVVYNHTGLTKDSNFNHLVPGYYYRQDVQGNFSNASACGNETASERPMVRKFILESVKYWAEEYHIDGFRFDLMGIHDIETMNQISATLKEANPSVFIYGEGWTGGDSPLAEVNRAIKRHTHRLQHIAAFSDDLRDAIKGNVFNHTDRGFISGKPFTEESIKFGIVAATEHPQIDYGKVNYSDRPWAASPTQSIAYASCHDNHTLWDRLLNSQPDISEAQRIKMHKLAMVIVLTSQGIPFLHAGVELLRTKNGVENSYKSPDTINQIDWSRKHKYYKVFTYYKKLIQLRKNHPAFRMPYTEMLQEQLQFLDFPAGSLVIGYKLSMHANNDTWKDILVLFNGNQNKQFINLPAGAWMVVLNNETINEAGIQEVQKEVELVGNSAMILYRH